MAAGCGFQTAPNKDPCCADSKPPSRGQPVDGLLLGGPTDRPPERRSPSLAPASRTVPQVSAGLEEQAAAQGGTSSGRASVEPREEEYERGPTEAPVLSY